jgi:hypothetical protein
VIYLVILKKLHKIYIINHNIYNSKPYKTFCIKAPLLRNVNENNQIFNGHFTVNNAFYHIVNV